MSDDENDFQPDYEGDWPCATCGCPANAHTKHGCVNPECMAGCDNLRSADEADDVEVEAPASLEEVLAGWVATFMSFADACQEGLQLDVDGLPPAAVQVIVNGLNGVGSVSMRAAQLIVALLEGAPADAPEFVAAAGDPGDLTCPRCDGPIPLAALQDRGICDTCAAREDGAEFGRELAAGREAAS